MHYENKEKLTKSWGTKSERMNAKSVLGILRKTEITYEKTDLRGYIYNRR